MASTEEGLASEATQVLAPVDDVRRLAQYRPFARGGLDLRAVLHDLVLAVAALEGGKLTSLLACRQAFQDCWGLEVEVDELRQIIDDLVARGEATKTLGGYVLSPTLLSQLEARARDSDETEERALREWELSVRELDPALSNEDLQLLRSDLRDWLHLIISRHGAEAALMLYPEEDRAGRFFEDVKGQRFDALPSRSAELERLREEALPKFIRSPTPDQRRFLANVLNVSFYMTVLTIDPTAKQLVRERLTGQRLYLDTNFLYAVLGGAPPAEVYSSRRLLKMSRDLGFALAITPWTLEELQTSIARSRREIEAQKPFVSPELADTMLQSSGDKGFNRLFWETYKRHRTQPKDMFDRLEHFAEELSDKYGIELVTEGCRAVGQQHERILEYASLLNKERWPYTKDWVVLEHDAKVRLLVERLRGDGNIRLSNARCWFLTYDAVLPRFARNVPENGDEPSDLPFCVSPSAWAQIIRALTPRTDDFERTVVDLLTSPYVGYRPAVNSAVVCEVVGRMDHYEDASPELAVTILADTAKVQEIEKAVEVDDEEALEEAVHAAFSRKARELQDAAAAGIQRADRFEQERLAAEAQAAESVAAHERERDARSAAEAEARREREAREQERRELEATVERAESARESAKHELSRFIADAEARALTMRTAFAVALLVVGIAIATALPIAVVTGEWPIVGTVVGGVAVALVGLRLLVGRTRGAEIATWVTVLAAIAAVVVTIAIGAASSSSGPSTSGAKTSTHSP